MKIRQLKTHTKNYLRQMKDVNNFSQIIPKRQVQISPQYFIGFPNVRVNIFSNCSLIQIRMKQFRAL